MAAPSLYTGMEGIDTLELWVSHTRELSIKPLCISIQTVILAPSLQVATVFPVHLFFSLTQRNKRLQ